MSHQRKTRKILSCFLIMTLLISLLPMNVFAAETEEEEVVAKLRGRGFKEVVNLGVPASDVTITSAVFGKENGRDVVYSVANGGKFNVVDVKENLLIFSRQLENVNQVWSHSLAPDGTVYIAALNTANRGELWLYSPDTKEVRKIGTPDSSHQFWSSTVDEKSNVYIGTYKEGDGRIFKYDKEKQTFIDFGKIDDNNSSYVRSMAYHDGYIYAGMGVVGRVYKIHAETMEKEDITKNVPELIGKPVEEIKFAYDMDVVGKYLFVRFDADSENALLFYNLEEQKWEDKVIKRLGDGSENDFGVWGFNKVPVNGDKAYVINNRHILEIDINTLETRETGIYYPSGFRGGGFVNFERDDLPGNSLVTLKRNGEIFVANIETGKTVSLPTVMEAKPLTLHNLGKGPDGNLYMTTYPGGPKGAQYNPKLDRFLSYEQGQAEGMVAGSGSDMYFGIYPGAKIQKMNTDTLEIETLFELKEFEQDRPYIMKYAENKLLIGTIPDYKKLGGALTIYNPEIGARETYRNVVQDQSIVGLALKDGKIYGSTTVRGGLDIEPTARRAVMFVWDIDSKSKIKEIDLKDFIPELDNPPMISGLTFDKNGILWGAVDGILFTMDPETYEVLKYKNFYPNVKNRGMWRPVHIEFGEDGLLYTDLAGKLTVVDPDSQDWDYVTLFDSAPEVDFMALAEDQKGNENIYFIENGGTELKMVPVIDGGKVVEPEDPDTEIIFLPVPNASFEEEVSDGKIPGWSSLFGAFTENAYFKISDERSKTGNFSLKVIDTSQEETVFAQSDPIPVEAGIEYTVSSELFLEDGSASFLIRFFDEQGKQVGSDQDGVNIIHIRGGHKEWQTVKAKVVAPEGAKFARIFLGASKYFTTSGAYFDDVSLTYEKVVEPEPEPDPKQVYVPINNHSFEEKVEGGVIPGWSFFYDALFPGTSYDISTERASDGQHSLKIVDTATDGAIHLQSDPIEVEEGIEYTATADVYLVDGRASFFIRFYDNAGNQVGADTSESLQHVTDGHGQWQTIEVKGTAPEGSTFARLFVGVSRAWVTNGVYYDNLSLSYLTYEDREEPGDTEDPEKPGDHEEPGDTEDPGDSGDSGQPGDGEEPGDQDHTGDDDNRDNVGHRDDTDEKKDEQSKTPADSTDSDKNGQTKKPVQQQDPVNKNGGLLPNTASKSLNILWSGLMLIFAGVFLYLYRRKMTIKG